MKDFFIINETGALLRANITQIDDADRVLKSIAQSAPVVLHSFVAPGVSLKATTNQVVLGKRLEHVKLDTWFAPRTLTDGRVRIVPVFNDTGNAVQSTQTFVPPSGHEVWFFQSFERRDDGVYLSSGSSSFLAWYRIGDNIYRTPFSNTFDDGRICMGNNWRGLDASLPPVDQLNAAVDWFQSASSNADLRPATAPIPLLMWDPVSLEQDNSGITDGTNFSMTMRGLSSWVFDGFFTANNGGGGQI